MRGTFTDPTLARWPHPSWLGCVLGQRQMGPDPVVVVNVAASRLRRAGRGGERARGLPGFPSGPRAPERPQVTAPHPEPCRSDSGDEHLARARAAPVPVLSAEESLALLRGHRRRDPVPPEPPRERRRPHPDPRANGSRQIDAGWTTDGTVLPLPRSPGI